MSQHVALIVFYIQRKCRHVVRIQCLQPRLIVFRVINIERDVHVGDRRLLSSCVSAGNVLLG